LTIRQLHQHQLYDPHPQRPSRLHHSSHDPQNGPQKAMSHPQAFKPPHGIPTSSRIQTSLLT
jgi:hypothetical protein